LVGFSRVALNVSNSEKLGVYFLEDNELSHRFRSMGKRRKDMNPVRDLLRTGKGLVPGIAALFVLAGVVSTAAAQPTIQPGEVLTYSFGPDDRYDVIKGVSDRSGHGYNGTSLSLDSESILVPGHKAGTFGIASFGDDVGGVHGGVIYWAGSGIFTHTDTHTVGIDTGPFTAMIWVNRGAFKGDNMLFGTTDVPALHMGFRGTSTYMGFWGNDAQGTGVPSAGTWHHMAYRYDPGTQNMDIFIDGANVGTRSGANPYGQKQGLIIGRTIPNNGAFAGLIEYPRVFNIALTDSQIAAAAKDNF
jgi:hypothetical protein